MVLERHLHLGYKEVVKLKEVLLTQEVFNMCGTFVPLELESAFCFSRQYFDFEEKSLYRSCGQGL